MPQRVAYRCQPPLLLLGQPSVVAVVVSVLLQLSNALCYGCSCVLVWRRHKKALKRGLDAGLSQMLRLRLSALEARAYITELMSDKIMLWR